MARRTLSIERTKSAFAARLRRMRLEASLTQKDLEKLSGIPKSRISRYENGHLLPSFQGIRRLAASLGVPDTALLEDADDPFGTFVAALRRRGIDLDSTEQAEELARIVVESIDRRSRFRGSKADSSR